MFISLSGNNKTNTMKTEKEIIINELETLIYLAELSERTLDEKKLKRVLTYIKNN
jgi:hypothetical protein